MIIYLYDIQSGHPDKARTHPTPYLFITILLPIFLVLYFTSPWLFWDYQFVLLNPFALFTHPSNLPFIWQTSKCSLYLWACFCSTCSFCFLDSTYKWNHMVLFFGFLFFSHISLSTIPSWLIHVVADGKTAFCVMAESCSVVRVQHFSVHLLMDAEVASILFGYWKQCRNVRIHLSLT